MTKEQYSRLFNNRQIEPLYVELLNASGWAGILPNGTIVDRRYFQNAIPVQKNILFGVAEPIELPKEN